MELDFCRASLISVRVFNFENFACCSATCAERVSSFDSHDGTFSVRCVKDAWASIRALTGEQMVGTVIL